jgi:hypothetical protein
MARRVPDAHWRIGLCRAIEAEGFERRDQLFKSRIQSELNKVSEFRRKRKRGKRGLQVFMRVVKFVSNWNSKVEGSPNAESNTEPTGFARLASHHSSERNFSDGLDRHSGFDPSVRAVM